MKNNIKTPTKREERMIKIMILLGLISVAYFLLFFFQPEHRGNIFLFILLCFTLIYSITKKLYMWYNYANISVPEIPEASPDYKVDILTTYFPGEPYQMIVTTLEAITNIRYPHTAYLCDEADDPYLKKFCEENGIIHVTRDTRKDAKAGNINNALETVATGDICVVLDPDHIPEPDFLDPIVPFFEDPSIGFVQTVQAYYNLKDTLVARGAAEQTFQFYGPMMMTLHSYGTVNAIGANCVFRRKALDSIGGHAPGLCEDMHTAMLLYAKGWKSVYLPEVLAKGLAPSNLTTYFKQQLKWSRGTFDLLFKVYPKVFSRLTTRQKIHFGILPLHYLSGLMYLINFLIPVLALFFSITPWKGNIVDFLLALLPVALAALFIRTFIQKWVIEKEERGFHITGGLLQINTWWIYIIGFVYTILNKNVLYLPTPKQSEFNTNLRIVIPNIAVALISIVAIVYGLRQDFTPFSILMAAFALFNACIMIFGIYLAVKVTNQNRILRSNLSEETVQDLYRVKQSLRNLFHGAFTLTRKAALPFLALVLIGAYGFRAHKELNRWKTVTPAYHEKISGKYLGIFHPPLDNGEVDLQEVNAIEARQNINFDIISIYLAWSQDNVENFPHNLLENIAVKNAIPLITWEPWAKDLAKENPELKEDRKVMKYIAEGYFDDYIVSFANQLAQYDKPVFLRFGHEFDNPQYPWSSIGGNSPADFKAAWKHIHKILVTQGANEVMMVWNPWKPERMEEFYPGDRFVDWVGLTILNYQQLNDSGREISFDSLYGPFKNKLYWFTRKPVMLAEFGSLNLNGNRETWLKNSMQSIEENHPEISAVVLFNSSFDNNIPKNNWYKKEYLDWTTDSIQMINSHFKSSAVFFSSSPTSLPEKFNRKKLHNLRGVNYLKPENWKHNYYVVTKENLLRDLQRMKDAGINTVKFKGGTVYEYNLLKYTEELGLKVIYEFNVDLSRDFLNTPDRNHEEEERLLQKVAELKDQSHVIAYSFEYDFELYFSKPMLFYQKQAYIKWLNGLSKKIRNVDPGKTQILNLPWNPSTAGEIKNLAQFLPVDNFGIKIKDPANIIAVEDLITKFEIPVFVSSFPAAELSTLESIAANNLIVENWQDERYSNRLSFDGLLDFSGRLKQNYFKTKEFYGMAWDRDLPKIAILKPAVPLIPGAVESYEARLLYNGEWIEGAKAIEEFDFDWMLIKNDNFGNPLAAKSLGTGASLFLKIPEDYKTYQLLLSATPKESDKVIQSRESLHTPVYSLRTY